MKQFSIIALAVLMITALGGTLTAFDVGGSITSVTSSAIEMDSVTQKYKINPENEEALGLWLETGRGEHYSFEMKADLIASFAEGGFQFYLNPDYFKIDGLWNDLEYGPSILATSLGRFTTSDFSTKVFSQKLDGAIWNFNYPSVELTIAAGTTAAMFSDTGSLATNTPATILSKTDLRQKEDAASLFEYLADPSGKSLFDSPRAVEILTLTLPQVVANQSVTLSLVAQEDLRPMMGTINGYLGKSSTYQLINEGEINYYADHGGAVDTQYIGAGISGPSIDSLYHNIYYYFGTGRALSYSADANSSTGFSYKYDMIISHMAGFSLDYFMPWLFNSRVSAGATFGTGDADAQGIYEGNREGDYTQFTPITGGGGGMIFSPGVSNVFSGNVSFSMKPFEWLPIPFISNLQAAISAMPFFRITEGPIGVSGISPNFTKEDGNYLGSEIDLTVNVRPFSDLGAMAQIGYFLPNSNAFKGSALEDPTFMAKLNVSLSF